MNRMLLFFIASPLFASGCGTYNDVTFIRPQTENGWNKSWWGKPSREYKCNGGTLTVDPSLVRSRKVAQAFFLIPLPGTAKNEIKPDLNEPLRIYMSFGPNFDIESCVGDLVWIRKMDTEDGIFSSKVQNSYYIKTRGLHFCTYEFPPTEIVGNEFYLHFSSNVIGCNINPLHFLREDSTTYIPGFLP